MWYILCCLHHIHRICSLEPTNKSLENDVTVEEESWVHQQGTSDPWCQSWGEFLLPPTSTWAADPQLASGALVLGLWGHLVHMYGPVIISLCCLSFSLWTFLPIPSSPISSMWTSLKRTTRDKQSGPLAHLQRWLHKSGWVGVRVHVHVRVPSLACYVLLPFSLKSPARTTQWRVFTWTCCSLYVMRDVTKGLSLCAVVWSSFPQWSIRILSYALGCYFIQFPLLLSYQQYVHLTKEDDTEDDTVQAGELSYLLQT